MRQAENEDIQPGRTPTPANRRIETKADELSEANRKLEDELQQANELLKAQKKGLQRLEMVMGEIQTKVGRVENGMDFR